ncbi:MAG: tetratricopeptide repeat protein [Pyrinomonadaceae bacterium]
MYLPEKHIYRFEGVKVDTSRECVVLDGEERHLRNKAFSVLVYLLEGRDRLISKNELIETVWENTAVTDDVLVQCIKEIRRAIGDNTRHPRFIKTVPKSGYRFIAPVVDDHTTSTEEVTQVEIEIEERFENQPQRSATIARWRFLSVQIAFASFLLASIAGFYLVWPSSSTTADVRLPVIEGRKSVAVMFFDNQSKSIEFDWLREGLADMLIAGLSRSENLTVLSREQLSNLLDRTKVTETALTFEKARALSRKSQAEYFVEGGFVQIGETIRIDVRLHETKSGDLLSAESLTVEKAEQLLSKIDLISLKLANRLGVVSTERNDITRVMTNSLEAYRFYSLAVEKAQTYHTVEAIMLFEKAIRLDPDFAMAKARIGYTYAVTTGDTEKGKPYLEKAYQAGDRLTEKDRMNIAAWYAIANLDYVAAIKSYREIIERFPLETEAYGRLSRLLKGEDQTDEAIDVLKQGLAIDPEAGELYNSLGNALSGKNRHAEAIAAHERYVALAPNEPNAYDSLGLSFQASGNYAKALENYQTALRIKPDFDLAIVHLGNVHACLGQYDEAIADYRRYISAAPSKAEMLRGYDSTGYIYFLKGEADLAVREITARRKVENVPSWNAYLIALRSGDNAKAEKLGDEFLADINVKDRGSRANLRMEFYYRGVVRP